MLAFPAGLIGFIAAPCCGLLVPVYLPFALNTAPPPVPVAPRRQLVLLNQSGGSPAAADPASAVSQQAPPGEVASSRNGPFGAFGMGFAIAITWTPCTGPTLGGILALSAASATVWSGSALLLLYALGLAVPFALMTVALTTARRLVNFQRRHARTLEIGSVAEPWREVKTCRGGEPRDQPHGPACVLPLPPAGRCCWRASPAASVLRPTR